MTFQVRPIGYVEAENKDLDSTALQSTLNPQEIASVRILPEFLPGLADLDGFDFAYLVTWLHMGIEPDERKVDLQPTPLMLRGTGRRIGLFSSRYPRRPNPIGLSLIRILSIKGDLIEFAGVDVVDGTPVLDIKPWVPAIDLPSAKDLSKIRIGWYADVDLLKARSSDVRRSSRGTERAESTRRRRGRSQVRKRDGRS